MCLHQLSAPPAPLKNPAYAPFYWSHCSRYSTFYYARFLASFTIFLTLSLFILILFVTFKVRNEKRFHRQAQEEIRILEHLRKQDKDNTCNIIHMFDNFSFRWDHNNNINQCCGSEYWSISGRRTRTTPATSSTCSTISASGETTTTTTTSVADPL